MTLILVNIIGWSKWSNFVFFNTAVIVTVPSLIAHEKIAFSLKPATAMLSVAKHLTLVDWSAFTAMVTSFFVVDSLKFRC